MSPEIMWLSPLLILPGIALLIVSTSARYTALHDEIHHVTREKIAMPLLQSTHLITRAVHFRNALVSLYIGVFLFVCASFIGVVLPIINMSSDEAIFAVFIAGIVSVGFAAFELIRESHLSLLIIRAHITHITQSDERA